MNLYNDVKQIMKLVWKDDDMMEQDTLFRLQDYMKLLAYEIASREGKTDDLLKTFPLVYKNEVIAYVR